MKRTSMFRSIVCSLGLAAVLTVVTPIGANAADSGATDTDGMIEISPGATEEQVEQQVSETLHELVGQQTPEEIAALAELPNTTFLADPDVPGYLAAVNTAPQATTFKLSWLSPGCGTSGKDTSMCLTSTKNTKFGYVGTGTLNVNISSVKDVKAGSRVGSATTSAGNIYVLKAWQAVEFRNAAKVVKLTRG